jgi:hypothetical protein
MDIEEKIVFAVSPSGQGDGVPVMLLGIPKGAWQYMRNGKTHTFDLTSAGIPVKLVLFGGRDHAEVMRTVDEAMKISNTPYLDKRRDDFAIKPKA